MLELFCRRVGGTRSTPSITSVASISLILLATERAIMNIYEDLKRLRRSGFIWRCTSTILYVGFLTVLHNSGRLCIDLLVCDAGCIRLVNGGMNNSLCLLQMYERGRECSIVDFVCEEELYHCEVATSFYECHKGTTHLFTDPITSLGISASLIPFLNHNQSPRNVFQCTMGKQAFSSVWIGREGKVDNILASLVCPQKALTNSKSAVYIGYSTFSSGLNALVSVISKNLYDLEDAFLLQKTSIERGLGRIFFCRSFETCLDLRRCGIFYQLNGVSGCVERFLGNCVDEDGLYLTGYVDAGTRRDYVGLCNQIFQGRDSGLFGGFGKALGNGTECSDKHFSGRYLKRFSVSLTREDVIVLREEKAYYRLPEIGDKLCTRQGQKGILGFVCGGL